MKNYLNSNILAFSLGIISSLYVSTPVGFVAMLDMLSYIVGPILLLTNFSKYTKQFRTLLLLLMLWIVNAIISDAWRGTPLAAAFKAEMILVNSLTLLVMGEWLCRKTPYALPLFLSGAAISAVISLYYFQNGALLVQAVIRGFGTGSASMTEFLSEKQVKPLYASCIFMTIIMGAQYFKLIPWFLCIIATFSIGVYMLMSGGARSVFLIYAGTAFIMFLYVHSPKTLRWMFDHKSRTIFLVCVAAVLMNGLYTIVAKNGLLGEEGYRHYEDKVAGEISFLDDRADLLINWPFLWRSPFVGAGSEFRDQWGYVNQSKYVVHEIAGHYIDYQTFWGHSCIVGAWTANGLFGLVFWLYVLYLIFDFIGKKVFVLGDLGPFVIFGMVSLCWAILFSPYGGFRGKAMFCAAFVALSKDVRFVSWMEYALKTQFRRGL